MITIARLSLILLLPLLSLSVSASNSNLITMELQAGFGGQAVGNLVSNSTNRAINHYNSEIKIQLFASSPFTGVLEIKDTLGVTSLPIQLNEQSEKIFWHPVSPDSLGHIEVSLMTHQDIVIKKKLTFELSRTPLTIISNSIPQYQTLTGYQPSNRILPVILSSQGLPHNFRAYSGVKSIVTDQHTLVSLSQQQYQALNHYLSQCGIMLLSATDKHLLDSIKNISGCNGRFIDTFDNLAQVSPMLLNLHSEKPPNAPAAQEMLLLQQSSFQQQMSTSLALYLCGYVFFMLLVTWKMEQKHALLILPILAAGAGIMVWSGSGSHQLVSWAETESGERYTRISSLLLLGGDRRGTSYYNFDSETQVSRFSQTTSPTHIQVNNNIDQLMQNSRQNLMSSETQLLSPHIYQLTSVKNTLPLFSLELIDDYPEIVFLGKTFPESTRLLWRGQSYKLPVLHKGEIWHPDKSLGRAQLSVAERLLNRRLNYDLPALLMPYSPYPAEINNSPDSINKHHTAWLVIRHHFRQSS